MSRYRNNLPQLSDRVFLTDGGLETTLCFVDGYELPEFAAFTLMDDARGRQRLEDYFREYAGYAREQGVGFLFESMTWRASSGWGEKIGYDAAALDRANRASIALLSDLRKELETPESPMVISGCMGPRGDGYQVGETMTAAVAEAYHRPQIDSLLQTDADLVSAYTMNYTNEAIGLVRAAQSVGMPVVISFTVETDGALPSGQPLGEAVSEVDAATGSAPVYYMINCAHPTHFASQLDPAALWVCRLKGLRANASPKSHAELDRAEDLDDGDPVELGTHYRQLRELLPHINVLGGCCGTDLRHVKAIHDACMAA